MIAQAKSRRGPPRVPISPAIAERRREFDEWKRRIGFETLEQLAALIDKKYEAICSWSGGRVEMTTERRLVLQALAFMFEGRPGMLAAELRRKGARLTRGQQALLDGDTQAA